MSECVEWTGILKGRTHGYGITNTAQRRESGEQYAHRHVWVKKFGPIPKGLYVCHHCDNPPCVLLAHLFLGTQGDNIADMVKKGRHGSHRHPELRRGERSSGAILTEQQVRDIRARHIPIGEPGHRGHVTALAKEYGVTVSCIGQVIRRRNWKHVA